MNKVMVVTGAFATHTTKLYDYYVCPKEFHKEGLKYIVVNYFKEIKYIGIIEAIYDWSFNEETRHISIPNAGQIDDEIINDLKEFECKLKGKEHKLYVLKPLFNCSRGGFPYKGKGAFTYSHRYFDDLDAMFDAHQKGNDEPEQ